MTLHAILHLHNVPDDVRAAYATWFDGPHRAALARLRGFRGADRYEATEAQIMPDIVQPWRFLSVYDVDLTRPKIDLPALGRTLAEARDAGLVADDDTERLYSYRLFGDWKAGPNWQRDKPLSGVSIVIGNYIPGRYMEYQSWYENVHSAEVIAVPGHVGMKRGELSDFQLRPRHHCPGDQLVMTAQQTDDLHFTIDDFGARALGHSPSGIAMAARSSAGSFARTVHYFRKISGTDFWPGGIAYAGDWSAYPARG